MLLKQNYFYDYGILKILVAISNLWTIYCFSWFTYSFSSDRKETKLPLNYLLGISIIVSQVSG